MHLLTYLRNDLVVYANIFFFCVYEQEYTQLVNDLFTRVFRERRHFTQTLD